MVQKNKRFVKLERTDIAPFRNDEYGISNDNKDMLLQMFTDNVTSSTENAVNANQVQPANQYSVNDLIQVETKILDTLESEQIDDGIKESTVEQGLGAIHSMIPQLVLDIYNLPIVTKSIDVFKQELSQITAPVTPEIHNLLGKYLKMIDTQMKIYSQVVDNTQVQQAQPVPVPTLPQPQARPATSQIQIDREKAIAQAQAQAQAIAQTQAQQPQQATAPIVQVNPANVLSQAPPPQAVPMPSATEGKKPRALDIVNFTNVVLRGENRDRVLSGINTLADKQYYDLIPKFYELVKANEQNITFNVIEIANLVKGEISKRLASILATNQLSDPLRVEYNRMISRLDQLGKSLKQEMWDDERYLEAQAQPLPALPAPAQPAPAQPQSQQSPIKLTNNFSFEKFIERVMRFQGDRIKAGLNFLISGKKPQYILEFAKYINEQTRKGNFEYNDDEEASIMNDTYVDILTTALVNIQPSYHEDIQKVMTGFVKLRRKWEEEDTEQQAPTPAVPAPAQPQPVKQEDVKVKVEDAQQDDQEPAVPAPAVPAPLTNNNFEYHIVPLPPGLDYKYNNLIVCLVPNMDSVNKNTFDYYRDTLIKLPQYEKGANKSDLTKEIIKETRSEGFYKLNYKKALSSLGYANILFVPKWQDASPASLTNRVNMISKIFGTMPDFIGKGIGMKGKATKKVTKKNNAQKNAPYYSEKDIIAYLLK